MTEIEHSVLSRQYLARRIADTHTLKDEVAAWRERRNAAVAILGLALLDQRRVYQTQTPLPVTSCVTEY